MVRDSSNPNTVDSDLSSEREEDDALGKGEAGRRKAKEKLRLVISAPPEHPFSLFLAEVKKRGVKNFDPSDLLVEALERVDEAWWDEKLDELTPLEYKITAALSDPQMREKLTSLLASQKLGGDAPGGEGLQ